MIRGIDILTESVNSLQYFYCTSMAKDDKTKKQLMGKVYREFSRQKYNFYKHKFPKMRESQIVSKIIKEWDALNHVAKDHLQKVYEKNKCLTLQDISSSEQMMREALLKKEAEMAARKSALEAANSNSRNIPVTKIFPPPGQSKQQSDSDYNKDSNQKDDSRPVDSSSPKLIVGKTKQIKKVKDYITFYRETYDRLHKQHPRWTSIQISSIVRLQWKKEKNNRKKGEDATVKRQRRSSKTITGYLFFRRYRGLTFQQAESKWRRFPRETKLRWASIASKKEPATKNEKLTLPICSQKNVLFLRSKVASQ